MASKPRSQESQRHGQRCRCLWYNDRVSNPTSIANDLSFSGIPIQYGSTLDLFAPRLYGQVLPRITDTGPNYWPHQGLTRLLGPFDVSSIAAITLSFPRCRIVVTDNPQSNAFWQEDRGAGLLICHLHVWDTVPFDPLNGKDLSSRHVKECSCDDQ
jgi:hypothetical protein